MHKQGLQVVHSQADPHTVYELKPGCELNGSTLAASSGSPLPVQFVTTFVLNNFAHPEEQKA